MSSKLWKRWLKWERKCKTIQLKSNQSCRQSLKSCPNRLVLNSKLYKETMAGSLGQCSSRPDLNYGTKRLPAWKNKWIISKRRSVISTCDGRQLQERSTSSVCRKICLAKWSIISKVTLKSARRINSLITSPNGTIRTRSSHLGTCFHSLLTWSFLFSQTEKLIKQA